MHHIDNPSVIHLLKIPQDASAKAVLKQQKELRLGLQHQKCCKNIWLSSLKSSIGLLFAWLVIINFI